jgi:hypothetical protein
LTTANGSAPKFGSGAPDGVRVTVVLGSTAAGLGGACVVQTFTPSQCLDLGKTMRCR